MVCLILRVNHVHQVHLDDASAIAQEAVESARRLLSSQLASSNWCGRVTPLCLYGQQHPDEAQAVIARLLGPPDCRKVVFATAVAETLTVVGVTIVVDAGQTMGSPNNKAVSILEVQPNSGAYANCLSHLNGCSARIQGMSIQHASVPCCRYRLDGLAKPRWPWVLLLVWTFTNTLLMVTRHMLQHQCGCVISVITACHAPEIFLLV